MRDILPRLIRHRDAPAYLGMDRNRFDREIRPHLIAIPVGSRAIAFDRLDLDAWVDAYKQAHGRAGRNLGGPPSLAANKIAERLTPEHQRPRIANKITDTTTPEHQRPRITNKITDAPTPEHQRPRHPRAATATLPAPAKPARTARHRADEGRKSPSTRDSYLERARHAISALQQDEP